jgi:hypothetical protein
VSLKIHSIVRSAHESKAPLGDFFVLSFRILKKFRFCQLGISCLPNQDEKGKFYLKIPNTHSSISQNQSS